MGMSAEELERRLSAIVNASEAMSSAVFTLLIHGGVCTEQQARDALESATLEIAGRAKSWSSETVRG